MSEASVRRATPDDVEAIVPLWRELARLHAQLAPLAWGLSEDAEARYREYFGTGLQDEHRRVFVAEQEGAVLGYLVAVKSDRPPVFVTRACGVIGEICVAPAVRRRGVGKALVAAALQWFRDEGLAVAELGYAIDNPLSVPFWEDLGFRPYLRKGLLPLCAEVPPTPADNAAATYFASVAEGYDRTQPVMAGPSYTAGQEFLLDLLPYEPEAAFTCAELGCGTATLLARVLARYPKARGIGLDAEAGMLEIAARKLAPFGERVQLVSADAANCPIPPCDVLLSSFMFHHVPPEELQGLLGRTVHALTPGGHFFLLDQMEAGPEWSEGLRALSRRLYRAHVDRAIAAGEVTQQEIDARWELKRRVKAEGQDVEYRHRAEDLLQAMQTAGFTEAGLVWRMFATTLLVGCM